jgi:murein DD-endopeptidase MepM/ murein hydrolase activator NlpD
MRPVLPARISQPFADPGYYASRTDSHGRAGHHTGVDFGSAWPIPIANRLVRSVLPGEVVISEYNSTMGHWVGVYNHEHDLLVTYWHMTNRKVQVGDWVQAYAPLGNVGSTGNSTAPHLHVQVNRGRYFNYHGHIHPGVAFKLIKRRDARRRFKANPVHPNAR